MMAVSLTCTDVVIDSGRVLVRFGKRTREFPNVQAVRDFVRDAISIDVLEAILIAKAMQANNPAAAIGKTVTGDMTAAANIVRIA
jgi:hypothetical protein